jgi:hypothetical protein
MTVSMVYQRRVDKTITYRSISPPYRIFLFIYLNKKKSDTPSIHIGSVSSIGASNMAINLRLMFMGLV